MQYFIFLYWYIIAILSRNIFRHAVDWLIDWLVFSLNLSSSSAILFMPLVGDWCLSRSLHFSAISYDDDSNVLDHFPSFFCRHLNFRLTHFHFNYLHSYIFVTCCSFWGAATCLLCTRSEILITLKHILPVLWG